MEFGCHHLRDLGVKALAHFGAAVIELYRAVGINVKQRTRLIEMLQGKRNSKLHWGQCESTFEYRAGLIEGPNSLSPRAVIRARFESLNQRPDNMLLDRLPIMGGIAPVGCSVEVVLSDVKGVETGGRGNLLNNIFDCEHALWATKSAERGVRHRIGFNAVTTNISCRQEVGIVRMKHRSIDNGIGQIGGHATIAGQV